MWTSIKSDQVRLYIQVLLQFTNIEKTKFCNKLNSNEFLLGYYNQYISNVPRSRTLYLHRLQSFFSVNRLCRTFILSSLILTPKSPLVWPKICLQYFNLRWWWSTIDVSEPILVTRRLKGVNILFLHIYKLHRWSVSKTFPDYVFSVVLVLY